LAIALPARNLALAQQVGSKLITPCAACYNRLKGADYAIHNETGLKAEIEDILGLSYNGGFTIRPVMGALYEDYGPDRLADEVKKPLKGLKVVTYYGCLLVRPPQVTEFDNPDNPQIMSSLLRALGAEVKSWSHATDCCGAGLSLSKADVVQNLVSKLADRAREAGADALATACPLCQVNLEMRQKLEPKMPAFYITELAGLAFGLPDTDKWWRKHLIDPRPVLKQAGLL
jgi:heterodisulfide reductase subunit B